MPMDKGPSRIAARWLAVILAVAVAASAAPGLAAQTPETNDPGARAGDAPVPIEFPRDDGPHDVGIEWWYYTGHLVTAAGERFGFEQVFFKGRRGRLEGFAAHVAVTDVSRGRFRYDERLVPDTGVSRSAPGFDLAIDDWSMRGANGRDTLRASIPGYGLELLLRSEKPAVLHDGDGYIAYGDGTASYYYSRTRLAVQGFVTRDGERLAVTGEAWMDHQWGDFNTFNEGGWDWFAVQLENGTELMLYLIRAPTREVVLVDGSYVAEDGALTVLEEGDFEVVAGATWSSPRSGAEYPARWTIRYPGESLELTVVPTLPDQELDTSRSTGVTYWEGEVTVDGTRDGRAIRGLGYVELTGYAPVREVDGA